jgi:hypothetical protein
MLKISAAMNADLTETAQAVYLEQLASIPEAALAEAFNRTLREWDKPSMFPLLSFIIARIPGQNPQLQAEQDWDLVQQIARHHWHPDVGFYGGGEAKITPAIEYALRQIGGIQALFAPLETAAPFNRRDFLAAHQRFTAEGGAQTYLSRQLAGETLKQLQSMAGDKKALPEVKSRPPAPEKKLRIPHEQTPEEFEQRKALLKRQFEEIQAKTPVLTEKL